jgi:hypothetical protein
LVFVDILEVLGFSKKLFSHRLQETAIAIWFPGLSKFEPIGKKAVVANIIQIAWLEIAVALEWNIYAGVCEICNSIFVQNKAKTKANCGSKDCNKAYKINIVAKKENEYRKKNNLPFLEDKSVATRSYNNRMQNLGRSLKEIEQGHRTKYEVASALQIPIESIEKTLIKRNKKTKRR